MNQKGDTNAVCLQLHLNVLSKFNSSPLTLNRAAFTSCLRLFFQAKSG